MWKIVMTDYEYPDLNIEEQVLSALTEPYEFIKAQCRTEEQVIEAARDAHALINQYAPISAKVIEALKDCRVISRLGVGVDTIDLKAASEHGIMVANVSDYCIDEVSDHALALLLTVARKITALNASVRGEGWDYKHGIPLYRLRGRVLGLLGFGKIPRLLAQKAAALGLRIAVYDPYVSADTIRQAGAEPMELEELLRTADFVSVHAPLNEATRGLIGAEQLRMMKPHAILINTARGPVINEADLIAALQERRIGGACLDVIEREPITAGHPYLAMDNVILTPHIAWYSEESQVELRTKCARNVVQALQGGVPDYWVNSDMQHRR